MRKMAGNAKPNVPDLGKEAQYQYLGGVTHSSDGRGLFDGTTPNDWQGHTVAYWSDSEKYVDVLIGSVLVNIWRSGADGWKQHSGKLKIQVKNQNGVFVDVTNNYSQNVNQIGNTQWEKTIENLPKGEYRFSFGTGYRLDSEWYIEEIKSDDIFLKVGESYIQKNETGEYSLAQEKTTIDLPIDITEQLKELLIPNNSKFEIVVCAEELKTNVAQVQTTRELNLLQDDLLQADEVKILNMHEKGEEFNVGVTFIPDHALLLASGDIKLKSIGNIDYFKVDETAIDDAEVKMIVSVDEGETWNAYNGDWYEVEPDADVVLEQGTPAETFNNIPPTAWNELRKFSDAIRFGYLINGRATVHALRSQFDMSGTWKSAYHGEHYDYEYTDNSTMHITLKVDGDYKINY